MKINRRRLLQIIGSLGTAAWLVIYIHEPSFPTPDKLLILLIFVFMIFQQALAMLKRLLPFVGLLLVYESFRGVAGRLNAHVDYDFAPHIDRLLFGNLPTIDLQKWWWHGVVRWYDYILYFPYLLHFVLPLVLALLIWKTRESAYWRFIGTFLVVTFASFVTFLIYPTAPPWLATQVQAIPPIERISSDVWFAMGIHNFPSLYQHVTPNPVAALPSLHAAWATLLPIFVYKLYGHRWALLTAIYPLLIYVGTVYEGEHYATDILLGIFYALVGYWLTPRLIKQLAAGWRKLRPTWRRLKRAPVVPKALKD